MIHLHKPFADQCHITTQVLYSAEPPLMSPNKYHVEIQPVLMLLKITLKLFMVIRYSVIVTLKLHKCAVLDSVLHLLIYSTSYILL
jgi:hypothetical protein